MLKKRCLLILKKIKLGLLVRVLFGALLVAGLFFVFRKQSFMSTGLIKPSQLNFTDSNALPANQISPLIPVVTSDSTQKISSSPAGALQNQIAMLSAEDHTQWAVFEDVLKSKNDNDPRLDQALRKLSPPIHALLFEKYQSIPAEQLSQRGLIVYLVARDLNSAEDVDFLKKVYQETPCLSLVDCKAVGPDDPHHSSMNQTTLVIAQLEGLYALDKQLHDHRELLSNSTYRNGVIQILVQAESFPVAVVREKAQSIRLAYEL